MRALLRLIAEIREVVHLSGVVDRQRAEAGPGAFVAELRQTGLTKVRRGAVARRRLHRIISLVDRLLPRPANCYRRALVEIAMDAGAATEPLHFGLRAGGGKDSGHAWLGAQPAVGARYDAEFIL